MNALLHSFAGENFSASVRPLSVAVVYEDNDTHRQATAVWEFMIRQLGDAADMTATWWRTSLLNDPKLSRVAAKTVAASDLILISIRSQGKSAEALKSWIDSWPPPVGRAGKLLAFLHDPAGNPSVNEWNAYFAKLAGQRNRVYVKGTAAAFTEPTPAVFNRTPASSTFEDNRRVEPYRHWGLNE